jgi:hypothetical protein
MTRLLTATAVTALMLSSALAQTTPPRGDTSPPGQGMFFSAPKPGELPGSKLLRSNVYGPDNAKIGDINDIYIERNGAVQIVVIGVGGFLGIGEKDVAIPFKELNITPTASGDGIEKITVRYTKEQLNQAPKFVRSPSTTTTSMRRESPPAPAAGDTTRRSDQQMASTELTPDQRRSIYVVVMREKVAAPPPADWRATVGTDVPQSVQLYDLPSDVAVPNAKNYRYTVAGNQVVLVDPSSRKVIHVITQ